MGTSRSKSKFLFVCIPWIGHRFSLSKLYFCRLLRCHRQVILNVSPYCLFNFLSVFLDWQPNVNYSIDVITIKFQMPQLQTEPCDFKILMCHLPVHTVILYLSCLGVYLALLISAQLGLKCDYLFFPLTALICKA